MIKKRKTGKNREGDALFADGPSGPPGRWISATIRKMTGAGVAKLEDMVERFNRLLPVIEDAGFVVSEIEAVMTLPPSVIAHVVVGELLEGEARAALLADIAHRKMASRFIRSLYKAAAFGASVNLTGFEFSEIEVEFGLIPGVTVKFAPLDGGHEALSLALKDRA